MRPIPTLRIALAIAAVAALAGCGGGSDTTTTSPGKSATTQQRTGRGQAPKQDGEGQKKSAGKDAGSEKQGGESTNATESTPAPTSSAPLPNEGSKALAPGVPTTKGGDNSIQTYGTESGSDARTRASHLVYLYCHGGLTGMDVPYIEIGPRNSPGISSGFLKDEGIKWGTPPPRPVVFINGCHTAALAPDQILDLVGGFVEEASAIGVIGTELTVFEPLAVTFGEAVLGRFLAGVTIGDAVRNARLQLLCDRNPLGLAYVPFVAADTQLVKV